MRGPGAGGSEAARRRRRLRLAALAVVGALVSAPTGWVVSDRLEQDNDFCNACHLEPGVPLHIELRRDFDAPQPASLAALHGGSAVQARSGGDDAFRCIDCHGGVSFAGRLRVKALAAKDAFWYVTGHFEEPDHMRWPLWDEDCRQCHDDFDESEPESWQSPRFHQLSVHNVELGVDCVECHRTHARDVAADAYFLNASATRRQCARCHSEFEEGDG